MWQFALIHGPDIPGSYAILLFTASDLASITIYHQYPVKSTAGYCFRFADFNGLKTRQPFQIKLLEIQENIDLNECQSPVPVPVLTPGLVDSLINRNW